MIGEMSCTYRVQKQRIFQKMFIYMLFYIDLTVQLDRTIERLMLQKFVRFLLLVALIACFVS